MKCPYCGGTMEQGKLLSARGAFFWPETAEEPPIFCTTRGAIRRGGGAPLWDQNFSMFFFDHPAWACRSCGKLVTDLEFGPTKTTG